MHIWIMYLQCYEQADYYPSYQIYVYDQNPKIQWNYDDDDYNKRSKKKLGIK